MGSGLHIHKEEEMKKFKKLSLISLSTLLALGLAAPSISAFEANQVRNQDEQKITITSYEESTVKKEDLIERVRELFPSKFDTISNNDFHLSNHRYYGYEDDTLRYNLHFSKRVGDNFIHGDFEFVGEELQLQHMYYRPANEKDAIFPPKVSKDEAEKIASEFLAKIANQSNYQLSDEPDYFAYPPNMNRPLTEAIEYRFYFERLENNIPVVGQGIHIVVLGNGDIIQFSNRQYTSTPLQFEEVGNLLSEESINSKISEHLNLQLKYQVDIDYYSNDASNLNLVYVPSPSFEGVHAVNGKWKVGPEFLDTLPSVKEIKFLKEAPSTSASPISEAQVRERAIALLEPFKQENEEIRIHGVHERENFGMTLIEVMYMFETRHGGYGSSISFNKETGDLIRFHNPTGYRLSNDVSVNITAEEALEKAVETLEELAPTLLHHYSYPTAPSINNGNMGVYHFSFPYSHYLSMVQ